MDGSSRLQALGARLRKERLRRNESQVTFAARIGVSIPTLRKMESGGTGITIGSWVMALEILDRGADIDGLLAEHDDLFSRFEALTTTPARKRASREKTP